MTRAKLNRRVMEFKKIKTHRDLAFLLRESELDVYTQSRHSHYDCFSIPKSKGGWREIENPNKKLKEIQRKINKYLQAIYFRNRTKAAHGFIINVRGASERTILTNALSHLNARHLINVDYKDFFHCISEEAVKELFVSTPFEFSHNVSSVLAGLCTHKGRLPMGAPTSPVLTNLYCRELDQELTRQAESRMMKYTRFVDDLTFSAADYIDDEFINVVELCSLKYSLILNPTKTKRYGPDEAKTVTGIIVTDRLELPQGFLDDTEQEICKLGELMKIRKRYGKRDPSWLVKHKQKVQGCISHAIYVMGDCARTRHMSRIYQEAINPKDTDWPMSWSELPSMI